MSLHSEDSDDESSLLPSQVFDREWITVHSDHEIDVIEMGLWMLFIPHDADKNNRYLSLDRIWTLLKEQVLEGTFQAVKSSARLGTEFAVQGMAGTMFVYNPNCGDYDEVLRCAEDIRRVLGNLCPDSILYKTIKSSYAKKYRLYGHSKIAEFRYTVCDGVAKFYELNLRKRWDLIDVSTVPS